LFGPLPFGTIRYIIAAAALLVLGPLPAGAQVPAAAQAPREARLPPGEEFFVAPLIQAGLFSNTTIAFGGGLAAGYGYDDGALGLKALYLADATGLTTLELCLFLRFYPVSRNNAGFFLQLDAGAALFALDGAFTVHRGAGRISADLTLPPQDLTDLDYGDKTLVVKGNTSSRTVGLASAGSLFTVGAAGTDLDLELQSIVVQGLTSNNASLIKVNTDGTLRIKTGGTVTGNTYATTVARTGGGGIYIDGGTLEIAGGEISSNTATATAGKSNGFVVWGGGVHVDNGGTAVMSGGSIKNNSITYSDSGDRHGEGGGIVLGNGSSFIMSGGSIEGNSITVASSAACGAGGGGVQIETNCSFVMSGGVIRNNTVTSSPSNSWGGASGGGVRATGSGSSFTMQGGEIYGNVCTRNRLNDYMGSYDEGAFGGGVMIGGTMQKTGGVIYGEDAAGSDVNSILYRNLAQDSGGLVVDGGQAVMYFAATAKTAWRDLTAGTGDHMNTADPTVTGGWE
jgi:hypothetical protein